MFYASTSEVYDPSKLMMRNAYWWYWQEELSITHKGGTWFWTRRAGPATTQLLTYFLLYRMDSISFHFIWRVWRACKIERLQGYVQKTRSHQVNLFIIISHRPQTLCKIRTAVTLYIELVATFSDFKKGKRSTIILLCLNEYNTCEKINWILAMSKQDIMAKGTW